MLENKKVIGAILASSKVIISPNDAALFDQFLEREENNMIVEKIVQDAQMLVANWKKDQSLKSIMEQSLRIPNGTIGKVYQAAFGFDHPLLQDIDEFEWRGLKEVGLHYDEASGKIEGTPTESGEIKLLFCFKLKGQADDSPFHEKQVVLSVNPDPKSLWKNIGSNKNESYFKEDNVTISGRLTDRNIIVSSKRGRSHANIGSFREDDFACKNYDNGWSLVAVSDGAGSSKFSRKGSSLACQTLVELFAEEHAKQDLLPIDGLIEQYSKSGGEEVYKRLNALVYNNLGEAALAVHKRLVAFGLADNINLKDLNATLIFVLVKKYPEGYAILSFGVGDCPVAVINKDVTQITLMNVMDVGEYGGGTRFITMPEIFTNKNFSTRFGFKFIEDFSFLVLMSDGIYDPKFVVEASLSDINKWKEFLDDLNGNNPEKVSVELSVDNKEIEKQLSQWMDFWSPGNHDDRTLAIVF